MLRNLLGQFVPLVRYIAADDRQQYSHSLLRETSVLSLCRLMSTSAQICEAHLPLLFTILAKDTESYSNSSSNGSPSVPLPSSDPTPASTSFSADAVSANDTDADSSADAADSSLSSCAAAASGVRVRNTIIIALGDFAFRFPNTVEPWTERLYLRLTCDAAAAVRYNALMVVTHLVLNDMIKVKGQVAHVARSLNDSHEAIQDLARLFFIKLSERSNNPVYNLLGDIIAIFSLDRSQVEEQNGKETSSLKLSKAEFQSTMHFLLSFVQKDK